MAKEKNGLIRHQSQIKEKKYVDQGTNFDLAEDYEILVKFYLRAVPGEDLAPGLIAVIQTLSGQLFSHADLSRGRKALFRQLSWLLIMPCSPLYHHFGREGIVSKLYVYRIRTSSKWNFFL
jgi:hypothetical protein